MHKRISYLRCKNEGVNRGQLPNLGHGFRKNSERTNINSYGLPRNSEERLRWIKAIPRINPSIIDEKKKAFVGEKHWSSGCSSRSKAVRNGKFRQKDPTSIFSGFKPSEIPTPPPPPRTTKNHHSLFEVERKINGMHSSMQIKSPSRNFRTPCFG